MAEVVKIREIKVESAMLTIEGISPLIQHAWSEKALKEMREKHAGKKTKNRDERNPEKEYRDAMYLTKDGKYGIPSINIKQSLTDAAHKDLGIEKTLVRKGLFIRPGVGGDPVLPMRCSDPVMREDYVRVSSGGTDLRYRPQFDAWELDVIFDFDAELLQIATIASLFDRAGFGVGLHEWRPEKNGEFGRFRVKR